MPLFVCSAEQAVAHRKDNPLAGWGDRSTTNRVEPVARPGFNAPFQFVSGESVFTIGSCFARNIEDHLRRRGFVVPMRELFAKPPFNEMSPDAINNYGAPSIFNEFTWALDPSTPFRPEEHILEVAKGKYADLHFDPQRKPEPFEIVLRWRNAIIEATRSVVRCRVVVMTLGLAEVWHDTRTGWYLNAALRPALAKAYPGRFELHVLSFDEVHEYLAKAMNLLARFGHPDLRVILTVSPVPITVTHRPMDVIVANTYSKSVLRAAVDAICSRFEFVTYFPSFESVMLSDRRIAWRDDLRHVTDSLVELNVMRMLSVFAGTKDDMQNARVEIEAGGEIAAVAWAERAARMADQDAEAFFEEFSAWSEKSGEFALHHATFLKDRGDAEAALAIVLGAPKASRVEEALAALAGECALAVGDVETAARVLGKVTRPGVRSHRLWRLLVLAKLKTCGVKDAIAAAQDYISSTRTEEATTFFFLAQVFADTDPALAESYLRSSLNYDPQQPMVSLMLGETLVKLGRYQQAVEILRSMKEETDSVRRHKARLLALVVPLAGANELGR